MKLLDKMHKYKAMSSSCLKCRKNTKNINSKISGTGNGKTMILSNFLYVVVKNQNLSRSKKQMDY